MNDTHTKQSESTEPKPEKKLSFIGQMFQKLDHSMKQKADEKSRQGSCCSGDDKKGGGCC